MFANTTTPHLVNASDSSGNILISCQLNGNNYLAWSHLMRTALRAKNKLGFDDSTIKELAAGDPNKEQWGIVNSMIIAWISNMLEKHL